MHEPDETPSLRSLALELTSQCNQRCRYCYNAWRAAEERPDDVLSIAVLEQVLGRVADQATVESITLTGGEPLLHPALHDVVARIRAQGLDVAIISNGRCVTPAGAQRLATQGVSNVQLTLAGPDASHHDAVCGAGSFAGVLAGVAALQAGAVPVSGSYLCTAASAPLAGAVFARFVSLGVTRVAFNRFNPSGFARAAARALLPTRTQVLGALAAAERAAVEHALSVTCTMPIPPCLVDEEEYPHVELGACAAGTLHGEPAVSPTGALRLCALQRHAVGDLRTSSLEALLASAPAVAFRGAVPEFCRGCLHERSCLGGCGAAAEWAFGTARALDPFVAQHVDPSYAERIGRPRAHLIDAGVKAGDGMPE